MEARAGSQEVRATGKRRWESTPSDAYIDFPRLEERGDIPPVEDRGDITIVYHHH